MDIYERLKQDHEVQKEISARLADTTGDSRDRRQLFEEFKAEVEAHAAAEEQTFYGALIEKPDGQEKARHSISEHKEAADQIEELTDLDMSSSGWLQKFKTLKEELEHHIEEEQNEVFQLAKKLIDDEKTNQLAEEFDQRKAAEMK